MISSESSSRKRSISDVLEHSDAGLERPSKRPATLSLKLACPPVTNPPQSTPIPFQQPLPLLTFSYTPARELEFTDSALRYYVDPPRNADLAYGYERWVRRPDEKGRIDALLRAYSKLRMYSTAGIGVVSWRGVMTK